MRLFASPRPLAGSLIGLILSYLIFAGFTFGQSAVDLVWDACPETDIAGYEVFYGTTSGSYTQTLDSGPPTTTTLGGLTPGATYYCAVRAYNTASLASPLSEEISFVAPGAPSPDTTAIAGPPISPAEIAIQRANGDELRDGITPVTFGSSVIGSASASEILLIRNTGAGNLANLSITVDGVNGSEFTTDSLKTTELAPGETTGIQIHFNPTSAGGKNAILHVASNDADESSFEIPLTGNGIAAPEISITLKGGSPLTDEKTFINFGNQSPSKSGKSKILTITNQGTATLTGLRVTKNGLHSADFSAGNLQKTTLAPGDSTTIKVTFKPTAAGIRWGALHIASNDADEASFDMTLTGKGLSTTQKTSPSLSGSPARQQGFATTRSLTVIDGQKFNTLTITGPAGTRAAGTVVEVSADLLDWLSGKNHTTVLSNTRTTLKVRDNTPVSADGKRYIRLKP